ncbi:MAG: PLP-dependent aminotransferase family protein [Hyphomicrobium sp.]|uniref:MocR-like pyridoxine biosynthesis transcription factor PdxR n=1 Tax=Hyphomicrobium sp. TaxID=82 RepID=UPI00132B2AD2|nr:PLP-dependent aminotransferase family protein [Hyphomicrobium sp.]KAB2940670.1 MAG: PLP-dependent aminotransferase family protein [Hyphomicrobium sp.]MBZ0211561.1 PLP-dependent aminotransferase family protein [Hyphomicrobium sp.]MCZ7594840.1 PLP-dependent aminotransferase family protein [Hyphomicrobium sp.]
MTRQVVLQLEPDSAKPIFLNLAAVIIREIERGRLKPGAALPGTRSLSKALGIHRNTVDAAYQELIQQGWAVTLPSQGTFVAEDLPDTPPPRSRERPAPTVAAPPRKSIDIAFSDGAPDARIAPRAELARAFRRAVSAPSFLRRSPYGEPRGSARLREALCEYLGSERGLVADPGDVIITRGSQMALFLVARALLRPGDAIAVEDPGYQLAWSAFRAAGANVVGIPVDQHGASIEQLAKLAEREPSLRAVYLTPHHQYPTTVTLNAARRLALLELMHRRNLILIEDDYDHEFRFDGRPVLPLAASTQSAHIVYVGSLSKLLAPELRIGYAIASPKLIERMATVRQAIDRQGDLPLEHAVAALIADGEIRRHARKSRQVYQARRDKLAELLQRHLASFCTFDVPTGGLAIWLRLSQRLDAEQWAAAAESMGLGVLAGTTFALRPRHAPNAFRLGFGALSESELSRAVAILARSRPRSG